MGRGIGMRILGIHDGANSCAALVEDGRVVAVLQEERLTGVKNFADFPHRAIKEVLKLAGRTLAEVDLVALGSQHMPLPANREELIAKFKGQSSPIGLARRLGRGTIVNDWYREKRRQARIAHLRAAGIELSKVREIDHHLAHAAPPHFATPWRAGPRPPLPPAAGGDGP